MKEAKKLALWKYIIVSILLLGTLYTDTKMFIMKGGSAVSTIEFLIYILNHQINICFFMLFAFIAIVGNIYDNSRNESRNQIKISESYYFKKSIYLPMVCIFLYVIFGIIAFLLRYGYIDFKNVWSIAPGIGLSPVGALLTSLIFSLFRFVSFSLIILTINIISNYPIGILAPIIISMTDYWFYDIFDIQEPLNILPIEHTRVFFTEAVAPTTGIIFRGSYTTSLLYWIICVIIILSLLKTVKSNRIKKMEIAHEDFH